jgi:D-serine dehydratase
MATPSKARSLDLDSLLDERVDWRYKGFPPGPPVPISSVRERGWNVLEGDFMLPVMLLKESALRHNVDAMAAVCESSGFSLSPHAKTSMAPQLVQMQLGAGAWAITAATMWQVRLWRAFGAGRIILANELVEPVSIRWLAAEQEHDPDFDFYCLVDSVPAVRLLESSLRGSETKLKVLLELGFAGGRTGCRTPEQAHEVAQAVTGSSQLVLTGVEAFEGVIHADGGLDGTLKAVDAFLARMRALIVDLDSRHLFNNTREVVVTAGGSVFPDRVIAGLGHPWNLSRPVRTVLRSGCYITHDAAHYKESSPFGSRLPGTDPLQEAMEVWGAVLSLPEPGLALLGFGKRDISYDLELPVPRLIKRGREPLRKFEQKAEIFNTNDQHAYLRLGRPENLKIGDLVGCGISHPCTAFDKWRLLPLVDDSYRVIDAILTYF